jgi:uncharacterized membrane protein YfcA
MIDPLYVVLGACVGLIVGMTGVGGGSLMTPALVLLFGIHPATAVGTDLLYAALTKSAGSLVHGLRKNVAWEVVALLACGSVPTAIITLFLWADFAAHGGQTSRIVTLVLGAALLMTALSLVLRSWLLRRRETRPVLDTRTGAALTVLVGIFLGFAVSISSVGAGAIGVTALLLLYPKYSTVKIVGTDIAHAVPLTFVAGAGHWLSGSVNPPMLLSLLIGSVPAIVLGSYLAPRIPEKGLRYLLALILTIVGGRMVVA